MTRHLSRLTGALIIVCLAACVHGASDHNAKIEVYQRFKDLKPFLFTEDDKTIVVNFWATTCKPCIDEMPHFNELYKLRTAGDLKIILVSTDKAEDKSKVERFVERFKIIPEVVMLDDPDYSKWTAQIDPDWYGALPATLIVKKDRSYFHFGAYKNLQELIEDLARLP